MNTTKIGRDAEDTVAKQLAKQGFKLIAKNWRTRWCEIDLVMSKGKTVYFIEVKYRANNAYGSGLDYLTPKKLQQMRFAAEMWLESNDWVGESSLAAVELFPESRDVELVELQA